MAPKSRGNDSRKSQRSNGDDKSHGGQPRRLDSTGKASSSDDLSLELQQLMLDMFKDAFSRRFDEYLPVLIQEVKQHLYHRDFASAFGKEAFLDAYAIRWSPSRALAYADLFSTNNPGVSAELSSVLWRADRDSFDLNAEVLPSWNQQGPGQDGELVAGSTATQSLRVVCLGGGAGAELLAFAEFLRGVRRTTCTSAHHAAQALRPQGSAVTPSITAVDIADWSTVLEKLYGGIITAPNVSKSERGAFVDANAMKMDFQQHDILNMDASKLGTLLEGVHLVTLMFTLNELYSTSMSATTRLLLSMTDLLEPGSLLLVVDSPGSYSTVGVGHSSENGSAAEQKKYPMHWLLDHTLLQVALKEGGNDRARLAPWKKLDQSESRWFRLSEGLKYPIDLEDMRYQYHFYKRI